jgi:hypothetical protein
MPLQAGRALMSIDQGSPTSCSSQYLDRGSLAAAEGGWTTDQAIGDATGVPYPTTTPRNAYASDGWEARYELVRPYPNQLQRVVHRQIEDPTG